MAKRSVYKASLNSSKYIEEIEVEFKWHSGFAVSQKQRSIHELHDAYKKIYKHDNLLEISSKSEKELGVRLSAFNLVINDKNGERFSLESAFQASKRFENGGPYLDILKMNSRDAKRDERLKTSGNLIGFNFEGVSWPLEPKTLFYDWLYVSTVYKNRELAEQIISYEAFTDIEFNPSKSINCQAKSAALFISLYKKDLLDYAMISLNNFKEIILNMNKIEEIKQLGFF